MSNINLREIFPDDYKEDYFIYIEIPDDEVEEFKRNLTKEIVAVYIEFQNKEIADKRRMFRYKAHYSLDRNDGIENEIITTTKDPVFEEYIDKLSKEQLYDAIASLPEKQASRVYSYYILKMNIPEMAKTEGTNKSQISRSIEKALKHLKIFLEKFD